MDKVATVFVQIIDDLTKIIVCEHSGMNDSDGI